MMPTLRLIWLLFTVAILFPPANSVTAGDNLFPPSDYIHSKLQQNDIVILGTTHKEPESLSFIADFTRKFSSLPGAVALDLDDRYRGWQMGLTATITIVPAECFELVDGLIIY